MEKNEQGLYQQQVDNETYEFAKWNTEESLEVLLDLMAIAGQSAGGIASQVARNGTLDADIPESTVDAFMGRIAGQLITNRPMVLRVLKKLATHKLLCNGKIVVFDTHYVDRLPHMFKVARYAAEVQYGNFFEEFKGTAGGSLLERLKSPAPPTPILRSKKHHRREPAPAP